MKLVSFDGGRIGAVAPQGLIDLSDLAEVAADFWPPVGMSRIIAGFDALRPEIEDRLRTGEGRPLDTVRLGPPIPWPNKVIAFPANYHAHIDEMRAVGRLVSRAPASGQGFFLKANSSLSGPADPILLPPIAGREIHHEGELGVVIGKGGRAIRADRWAEHVFGYTCLLDMVVRGKEERVMRKSFDSFCPTGPWIVTADEVPDPANIGLVLTVNGDPRQSASTRDLIVDIPSMVAMASSVMTLHPGDIIASGTPAGVAAVKAGDVVEIAIEHVGAMRLDVREAAIGDHQVWHVGKEVES